MTRRVLERLAEYFYDPVVFWGVPLLLVAINAAVSGMLSWIRRSR